MREEGIGIENWVIDNIKVYKNCSISKKRIKSVGGEDVFISHLLKDYGLRCELLIKDPGTDRSHSYLKGKIYIVKLIEVL